MNKQVVGIWAAGFFALGSGLTLRDLRRGSTRLWPMGNIGPYVVDRAKQPARFWIYVSLILAVLSLLLGAIFAFAL